MRRLLIATGAAALLAIAVVATVAAAGPMGRAGGAQAAERAGTQANVIADTLRMTRDAIEDLRHDGLSLAKIAEKQNVKPQKLVDALVAQWTIRIHDRVEAGALTADQATALRTQLATRAKDMVYRTTLGGMQGAAVGAGPANAPGGGAMEPAWRFRGEARRAAGERSRGGAGLGGGRSGVAAAGGANGGGRGRPRARSPSMMSSYQPHH
jgi:hypothetical protein